MKSAAEYIQQSTDSYRRALGHVSSFANLCSAGQPEQAEAFKVKALAEMENAFDALTAVGLLVLRSKKAA